MSKLLDLQEPSEFIDDIPAWVLEDISDIQKNKADDQKFDIPTWVLEDFSKSIQTATENINTQQDTPKKDERGFFYIIKTPDVPEGVYKIGKTIMTDPNKRLCKYPTYSCCLYTIHVQNADLFEDLVMRKLKGTFKRRMEYGLEYYEADIRTLINEVHNLWLKYGSIDQLQLDKSNEKMKPNGWQYFANEWLAKHPTATAEEAYPNYVETIKTIFMSNEYAEFEFFSAYFNSLSNPTFILPP